jgi:hypothetical protein
MQQLTIQFFSEGNHTMQKASILVIACVMSLLFLPQQPSASTRNQSQSTALGSLADAPSREEVLQLFGLLQIKKLTETSMQAAKEQAKTVAEQMLREEIPDPTPEQQKLSQDLLRGITEDVMTAFPIDEMLNAMVPIYQRHLTRSDLQAIVSFYSSAVGQKLLREQPQMMQESMQAMMPIQQRMMEDLMRKITERIHRTFKPKPEEKDKSGGS